MTKLNSAPQLPDSKKTYPFGLRTIMELFDIGPVVAITALSGAAIVVLVSIVYFIRSAPPSTITISAGPEGTVFQKNALKYAKILERNGVKLNVVSSKGSLENLQRLADPQSHVDVGIVQSGITNAGAEKVESLGSISYQPLMLFYRGKPNLQLLSQLERKKIAIGPIGSGARNFALALLAQNGIKEGGNTTLLDWDALEASNALLEHKIDAAFVMSESASTDIMHKLLHSKEVNLYSFKQANAYSRKVEFLNILELPEGSLDLGLNIPSHDVFLLGPMVELLVKKGLHPALTDLLIEAATEVHSKPGMFQRRGEFPAPIEHAVHISEDASTFYKSGKSFFYRYLPYWLASLISRIIVVFLPILVIIVPVLRSIPAFFRWRMQAKIRRRYRELLSMEQEFLREINPKKREDLRHQFDAIDAAVNKMSVRAAFADQFYGLRGHIDYVRQLVEKRGA